MKMQINKLKSKNKIVEKGLRRGSGGGKAGWEGGARVFPQLHILETELIIFGT